MGIEEVLANLLKKKGAAGGGMPQGGEGIPQGGGEGLPGGGLPVPAKKKKKFQKGRR
jgi:hypothetical protein